MLNPTSNQEVGGSTPSGGALFITFSLRLRSSPRNLTLKPYPVFIKKRGTMARVIRKNTLTTNQAVTRVSVSDAYSIFLRVKKSECAPSTYRIYCEIGERHIVPKLARETGDDMNKITAAVVRFIIDDYESEHELGGTNFLFRHLKSFINWYWNEYEITLPNPMANIKAKKVSNPPKEGITQHEVDKLLSAAKNHSQFPERDVAFIMVLCDTGIRRSSIEKLTMQDVNLLRNEMLVYEKDQKYHIKAFGNATAKAIKKYLLCLADIKPTDPFWLQADGKSLTRVGMREVLRRLSKNAGIPFHEFHDFRRYYGKALYDATHDIYLVSRALDHKDIYVTKRYIAIDDREDAESMRVHSPMDKKFRQTKVRIEK